VLAVNSVIIECLRVLCIVDDITVRVVVRALRLRGEGLNSAPA